MIRLANNNLVDTTGLYQMALDVVEFPEDIAWLDLSFNEISVVSDDILEFPGEFSLPKTRSSLGLIKECEFTTNFIIE